MSISIYRANKGYTKSRLKKMVKGFVLKQSMNKPERYCKNHPLSIWGKDKKGQYYARCYEGFKKNEVCDLGD